MDRKYRGGREMGFENVDWIHLPQDRGCCALVNVVILD
jgi:hypothetical protein